MLFTYVLCSSTVWVIEQLEVILRTGFDISTLSSAVCSVSSGRKYIIKQRKRKVSWRKRNTHAETSNKDLLIAPCVRKQEIYFTVLSAWNPLLHSVSFFHLMQIHFAHQVALEVIGEGKAPNLSGKGQEWCAVCGFTCFSNRSNVSPVHQLSLWWGICCPPKTTGWAVERLEMH